MSRPRVNMSLTCAVSMWLLVTFAVIASASLSDRAIPLRTRQPLTRLRLREQHQETSLQTAIHSTLSAPLISAASNSSSYQATDNGTVLDLSTYNSRPPCTFGYDSDDDSSQYALDSNDDTQHNPVLDDDDEECPTGIDTLECDECGGPEHTWDMAPNLYHCIGIEEENWKWKDCYCLNYEDSRNCRGPCTFNSSSDDGSAQHDTDDTRHDSDSDDDSRYDSACETDD